MNIFPYLFDYISILFESKEAKNQIRGIILFGSAAAGEHDKDSDIDLFIDVPKGRAKTAEKTVREAEKRFHAASAGGWSLRGITLPIKTIVGDLNDSRWKDLKSEMLGTGITLYRKFEELPEKLRHLSLFTYSLNSLAQKEKMRLLRKLFGYKSSKEGKEYIQEGVVAGIGGKKLSSNSLLIPVEKSREIQKLFTSFSVTPEIREVWLR